MSDISTLTKAESAPADSTAAPAMRVSDRFYEWLRRLVLPTLRNSQYAYAERLRDLSRKNDAWLDVGCGHHVVPSWAAGSTDDLTPRAGLDPDAGALSRNQRVRWRVAGRGEQLPFADASFDLVSANMVLEHVESPAHLFREVRRILKPGGRFVAHTPNLGGYTTALTRLIPESLRAPLAKVLHDRLAEDVYPTFYRANSAKTLRELAADAGFTVCDVSFVHSSPQLIRVPPLLVFEMGLIRALSSRALQRFRSCLIVICDAPAARATVR